MSLPKGACVLLICSVLKEEVGPNEKGEWTARGRGGAIYTTRTSINNYHRKWVRLLEGRKPPKDREGNIRPGAGISILLTLN